MQVLNVLLCFCGAVSDCGQVIVYVVSYPAQGCHVFLLLDSGCSPSIVLSVLFVLFSVTSLLASEFHTRLAASHLSTPSKKKKKKKALRGRIPFSLSDADGPPYPYTRPTSVLALLSYTDDGDSTFLRIVLTCRPISRKRVDKTCFRKD
jgi:hypothetical protein